MPKVPATYQGRLAIALSTILELSAEKGAVEVSELASCLGVTERMAREYLSDLEDMGVVSYAGVGVYTVNRDLVKRVLSRFAAEGGLQLRLDDFIPETPYYIKKAAGILSKIGLVVEESNKLREKLVETEAPPDLFAGSRFLYTKSYFEQYFKGLTGRLLGEASHSTVKNYIVADVFPLTVAYVSSVAAIVEYNQYGEVISAKYKVRPKLRRFESREPFEEGEPLYELSVEYPELLLLGRKMAARLLKDVQKYLNLLDALTHRPKLALTYGSLKAHGFVLPGCKTLRRLVEKCDKLFQDTLKAYSQEGVLLASITDSPRDDRYFKAVQSALKLKLPKMSDQVFLSAIMEDGDATPPMKVPHERGKDVENWYEFYFKRGRKIYKIEFVTTEDPMEVQKELIGRLYPQFLIGGRIPAVSDAQTRAEAHVHLVAKRFEASLKIAALAYSGKLEGIGVKVP